MDQLISAHLHPLRLFRRASDPKFVFDYGVQGGGDLHYYLFHKRAQVANPLRLTVVWNPGELRTIRFVVWGGLGYIFNDDL